MNSLPTIDPSTPPTHDVEPPICGEPYLLTPGPLTTAASVKKAMLKDWGSWDGEFRQLTAHLRERVLAIIDEPAGGGEFDCVPLQGSGTFIVEAMLGTLVPKDGKVLVLSNGAYGQRMVQTLGYLGRRYSIIDKGDYLPPRGDEVSAALKADRDITHVVVVHCETSSGILNPIDEIATAVHAQNRRLLVDSMSAFGALPLQPQAYSIDAIVSSANKCLEGVPGFGFAIVRKSAMLSTAGNSHSLSLDLHAQWQHMEKTGQWRFTPPTHTIAAFHQALDLYDREGGAPGRLARYQQNRNALVAGFTALGFQTLLSADWLSPIIVTFFNPADPRFDFNRFYTLMKEQGFIIYPGKLTVVDSFRVGCIGQLNPTIMANVAAAAGYALEQMGVTDAAPPASALQARAVLTQES